VLEFADHLQDFKAQNAILQLIHQCVHSQILRQAGVLPDTLHKIADSQQYMQLTSNKMLAAEILQKFSDPPSRGDTLDLREGSIIGVENKELDPCATLDTERSIDVNQNRHSVNQDPSNNRIVMFQL
jgi:replicative superfamily II helicase